MHEKKVYDINLITLSKSYFVKHLLASFGMVLIYSWCIVNKKSSVLRKGIKKIHFLIHFIFCNRSQPDKTERLKVGRGLTHNKCCCSVSFIFFFFFLMFIYFWEREREWAWTGEGQRERETQNPKQAPGSELAPQSPWGSNSRTVRSWPEPKSDA